MKRKRNGRASKHPGIWDLGNGRYRVRATVLDPVTGKQRERERMIVAGGIEQAVLKRAALIRELTAELMPGNEKADRRDQVGLRGSMLLGIAADAWLQEITARKHEQDPRQPHLCPSTAKKYQLIVRDFVMPSRLARMTSESIDKDDVRTWRREQLEAGYASATVNGHFAVLQLILRAAGNADAVDLPMLSTKHDARTNRREPNKLNAAELDRFLKEAREHQPQCYPAILMLFTTTLRPGALLALRMDDLDLETMEVVASRRLSEGEIMPGVKGDRFGEDTPPLLPEVHEAIMELRKSFNDEQLASGLVFPARDGGFHDRGWLRKGFADVVKRAGITKRFTPTGCRRTGETLYGRTAGTRVAMAISGHRTEAMHRHYGGVDAEEKLAAAKAAFGHLRLVAAEKKF